MIKDLLTQELLSGDVSIPFKRMTLLSVAQRMLDYSKDKDQATKDDVKTIVMELGKHCPWLIDTLKAFQELSQQMAVYRKGGLSVEDFLHDHGVDTSNFGFYWGGETPKAKNTNHNRS